MPNELISNENPEPSESLPAPSQLSLIKISSTEVAEVIRPEANLEKWQSFIFPHPKAAGLADERVHSYDVKLPDERDVKASISVNPANGKTSTTSRSYDVYLAIVAIWDDRGLPEEPFLTSIREILKMMTVPLNGKWFRIVEEELERLYTTTFKWRFAFHGDKKHESVAHQQILETYDYTSFQDRADQSDKFDRVLRIRLDAKLRNNHRNKRTNPILWSERKSITSSIAKVLYGRLDTFLYRRGTYERRAERLVDDLFLTKSRYKYVSQRKILLEKLKQQLDGRWLSTQRRLKISIQETSDQKDLKLVCKSINVKEISVHNNLPVVNKNKDHIKYLVDLIIEGVGGDRENYRLYEVFSTYYSEQMIRRALGEYKESSEYLKSQDELSRKKHFTVTMHRIAHDVGRSWIKNCKDDCKYRKKNSLI